MQMGHCTPTDTRTSRGRCSGGAWQTRFVKTADVTDQTEQMKKTRKAASETEGTQIKNNQATCPPKTNASWAVVGTPVNADDASDRAEASDRADPAVPART